MARVLFVCLHNAGRSPMSEAFLNLLAGGRHEARSAGTTPGPQVHPEVVEVMREVGVDLSSRTPQRLTEEGARWAEVVVTLGCGDPCPAIPGARHLEWEIPDPRGLPLDEVRRIRDEIRRRVSDLIRELDRHSEGAGGVRPPR